MKIRISIFLLIVFLSYTGKAQEETQQENTQEEATQQEEEIQENKSAFSMDEAIDFALKKNRSAINAGRDVEAAEKQKWEAMAKGLPQLNGYVDYQNFLKQPVSLIPSEIFGDEGEFIEVAFGTKQNVNAGLTLSQLLFDGSYIVGLQSAKVFLEISRNAKEKTDLEVRKAVINAYGNVLVAEESVKILEKNKANLEKNLADTRRIYENGLIEEENVEQLQITLSDIENSYNNAARLKDIAYKLFNLTLGIDVNASVRLTDNLQDLTMENTRPELVETSFDIKNNVDYKIASNNKRTRELLLKLEKSRALPTLTSFLNAGYQGFSDSFTFLDGDQDWFGSSLLGVSLNIPVFSSFDRHARTQRARIALEKSKTMLTETEQQLRLELETARSNYQFAIEQYNTSKSNLELAERIEEKNQIKYAEGISSSFDLRQAQTQLYSIQQDYLQAMLAVINSKTNLETILNRKN